MKSIQFYNKLDKVPHARKLSLKRNHKQCKRNHGKPHEFVVIKVTSHEHWKNWTDLACRHCGKREYLYESLFGIKQKDKKLKIIKG